MNASDSSIKPGWGKPQLFEPLPFPADPSKVTFGCTLTVDNDMEAMAAAYNRWYRKARPIPLVAIDGRAYRRRILARQRRNRRERRSH